MKKITTQLIDWHRNNVRDHPWKKTKDPYKIWISEIILQQTRTDHGSPYYEKFVKLFPTVFDLAKAENDEVMKAWQGLGYYSRARNIHHTSKIIVDTYKGKFPSNYHEILNLKGIGLYSAAAISSFAFELPHPVIDGNVLRFFARFLGITDALDSSSTRKKILEVLEKCIVHAKPSEFNQAIMDMGALVCTPRNPKCESCPVCASCVAFAEELTESIPIKRKKISRRDRFFHYLILLDSIGNTFIHRREEKDIWAKLYQFPLIENDTIKNLSKAHLQKAVLAFGLATNDWNLSRILEGKKHVLSHQDIHAKYYVIESKRTLKIKDLNYNLVKRKNLMKFALPRMIDRIIPLLN